jgi:hypothetical protein
VLKARRRPCRGNDDDVRARVDQRSPQLGKAEVVTSGGAKGPERRVSN